MAQKSKKIVAQVAVAPVAKAARLSHEEVFAKRVAGVKSTGNASLDTAMRRLLNSIHDGAKMEKTGEGYTGIVGKARVTITRQMKGKAPRFQIVIGEGSGFVVEGGFASFAYQLSAKQNKVPRATAKKDYDQTAIDALCADLGI